MSIKSDQIEASFGKWLKERRTAQKITIEEISARTSIRSAVLEAIEAEAHDQLPAKVYTASFIRSFANEVGLDPDEVLRRYLLHRGREIDDKKKLSWGSKYETYADKNRYLRWLFICLAGVTLLIAAWWGYVWLWPQITERIPAKLKTGFLQTKSQKAESVNTPAAAPKLDLAPIEEADKNASTAKATVDQPDPSTTESTQDIAKSTPVAPEPSLPNRAEPEPADESGPAFQAPEPVETAPISSEVQLKIVAVATTWLRITRDDDSPREYTLLQGDQKEINALSRVDLLIGNAGGVILTVNGQPYPLKGAKGDVVRVSIP